MSCRSFAVMFSRCCANRLKRGLQENNCTYPLDLPALAALAGRFNPATGSCKQLTTHSHETPPLSTSKTMEPFFKRHPFVSPPVEQLPNVPVFLRQIPEKLVLTQRSRPPMISPIYRDGSTHFCRYRYCRRQGGTPMSPVRTDLPSVLASIAEKKYNSGAWSCCAVLYDSPHACRGGDVT